MRVIHLAMPDGAGVEPRAHVDPACGAWGSMDTDWTDVVGAVTCAACRAVLRAHEAAAPPAGEA
jgi:hypothetical protein